MQLLFRHLRHILILQTFVMLRESVCIDNVKTSVPDQLLARYEILPSAFEDHNAFLLIPTEFSHTIQNVTVRLYDNMPRWWRWKWLEEAIDLHDGLLWPVSHALGKRENSQCPSQTRHLGCSTLHRFSYAPGTVPEQFAPLPNGVIEHWSTQAVSMADLLIGVSHPIMTPISWLPESSIQMSWPSIPFTNRKGDDKKASVDPVAVESLSLKNKESGRDKVRDASMVRRSSSYD